ncbi:hypothetical protein SAY87_004108 [Trapa incisa]|uniref:tRNA-uridine aminocarboxypropyltransferase n=1 Tax=Trapa incisa TaxID=236973 RepID=A0AAN7JN79_9MYRT|nr:hypothetical protein SAY87_004108 [Trapa incisa]
MSALQHRARILCPLEALRFLILPPPPRHGISSPFSVALKMVATSAPSESRPGKRSVCPTCSKPRRTCLCDRIHPPELNSIAVTVLQHSLEKKHPLNSTRIVRLGFKNVTIATVSDVNEDARFSIWTLGKESEVGPSQKGMNLSDSSQEMGIARSQSQEFGGKFEGEMVERELLPPLAETVIDISIVKKGEIRSIKQTLRGGEEDIHDKMTNFEGILESELCRRISSKGFVVRKLQRRRRVNKSLELEESEEFVLTVPSGSVLLFPTEKALSIDELKAKDLEVKNLIVLDGTWLKARRMYSENPWLRFLPHMKLDPQVASLYGEVRSQPRAGCLSTLESIVYTLKELGDDCSGSMDHLLEVFGSMVDDQRVCKSERLKGVPATE